MQVSGVWKGMGGDTEGRESGLPVTIPSTVFLMRMCQKQMRKSGFFLFHQLLYVKSASLIVSAVDSDYLLRAFIQDQVAVVIAEVGVDE